jgi:hypothetical protein
MPSPREIRSVSISDEDAAHKLVSPSGGPSAASAAIIAVPMSVASSVSGARIRYLRVLRFALTLWRVT